MVKGCDPFCLFFYPFLINTMLTVEGKNGPLNEALKYIKCEQTFQAHPHGAMCNCDLLYQEMECCLRFSDFIHKVRRVWIRFPMNLHCWNRTSQSHRMGVEPNRARCHTHQCIVRTPLLSSTQSILCIAVANQKKKRVNEPLLLWCTFLVQCN